MSEAQLAQRRSALQQANRVRTMRRNWKQDQRTLSRAAGSQRAADLLAEFPDWCHTWAPSDMVRSISWMGPKRCHQLMHACRISAHRATLSGIGMERRQLLIHQLRKLAAHPQAGEPR